MRAKELFCVCLVLAIAAGCRKKSEPIVETEPEPIEYFAVFMEGEKVGYVIASRVVSDEEVRTSEKVSMTISRGGIPVTINTAETGIETIDGEPLGFELEQRLGTVVMKMAGVVEPNGTVSMTTSSMGSEQKSTLEWPQGAVMAEGLRLLTLKKGLKEGTEYSAKVFSASVMQALDAKIRIGPKRDIDLLGRVVSLTEVTTTMNIPMAGEMVSTSYVDSDLRMQKTIMPIAGMRVEMVACAKEFALGKNDVFEVINKMFVKSPVSLGQADKASAITYTLSPIEKAKLIIPSADSQQVQVADDGKVVVTVKPAAPPAGARFPYKGRDETILEALKPNRFLQSDDAEIIKLARRAVGSTKDAGEAIRKIEAFVAEYIEHKDLSVGYASATEVAASRQGDCSEHAVLAAAMCRAVGIPAQVVTGIAYVEEWAGLQGFGGHAWVRAYVGGERGKWVGLDAAFKGAGLGGYGAGHIALAMGNGEPADFFNLATTLGRFKIDKVIVKK